MEKLVIIPHDVVTQKDLGEISVDNIPADGDPLEIDGELYFVCQKSGPRQSNPGIIGVIPLVVRNPAGVKNIQEYIECLSIAHRRVQFKNKNGLCDFTNCDEMVIT
jgi:hypothetical protein